MKIKFFALCTFFILIQCTVDQEEITDFDTYNLSATSIMDLAEMKPNPKLDNNVKGLYQGTIATQDLSFHEKITINFENDNTYSASIKQLDGSIQTFSGVPLDRTTNTVLYTGDLGQFKARSKSENTLQVDFKKGIEVFDATINDTQATITAFKDRNAQRVETSLGTFASDDGTITGTWDFTFERLEETDPGVEVFLITEVSILRSETNTLFSITEEFLDVNTGATAQWVRTCNNPLGNGTYEEVIFDLGFFIEEIPLANDFISVFFGFAQFAGSNISCLEEVPNISDLETIWIWNGVSGENLITIDSSSLPSFAE